MPNYKRLFIQNTYLFLTITTNNRRPILIDNIELLRESFKRAKHTYKFELYASVILPDHMHLIIIPERIEEYPKIIFAVKYHFSRNIDGGLGNPPYIVRCPNDSEDIKAYALCNFSKSKIKKKEKGIWQRRYFEHTIRDENDLNNHLDYIHYNPVKHDYVKAVKDWKFSSFDKFVGMKNYDENWGNYEDVKHIATLEYD